MREKAYQREVVARAAALAQLGPARAEHEERVKALAEAREAHEREVAKHAEDVRAFNEAKALHEATVNETLASAKARLEAAAAQFKRAEDLAKAAEDDRTDAGETLGKLQAALAATKAKR